MKKVLKNKSLFEYFENIDLSLYTKQTILSLFRSLLETVIDSRSNALVIFNVDKPEKLHGVLNRLSFTDSDVFSMQEIPKISNIKVLDTDVEFYENFLVLFSDRFSVTFVWDKYDSQGFHNASCTLHPEVNKKLFDYIQKITESEDLLNVISSLRMDRRENVQFDLILSKLLKTIEESQRDLICAGVDNQNIITGEDFRKTLKVFSHEIRNPLGMMGVYAKILSNNAQQIQDKVEEQVKESLESAAGIIQKGIENIETLLSEMSNYSATIELCLANESIEEIISDSVDFVLPALKEKDIFVEYDINDIKGVELNIDKNKFYQVMLNLLKNAMEASPAGSNVKVISGVENDTLYIEIKDSGCGVSDDNKEKIFMPFFTTKKKGTGVGLAHSRKIIKTHGGNLELKETDSKGSVFRIELPL